jgi:hypothetical protein
MVKKIRNKNVHAQKSFLKRDRLTEQIVLLLKKIPSIGNQAASFYLWKPMLFNDMLVGATGTVLSWVIYEHIFRPMFLPMFGGTFIGMVLTTIIIYVWNYNLSKNWSLKSDAQVLSMRKPQLLEMREKIDQIILNEHFDKKGKRVE